MTWVKAHAKALTAAFGALVTLAVSVWGTSSHWVELATVAATALGVYGVPNVTPARRRGASN